MDEMINDILSDKNVVVITGAGVSTLSGIKDFRGKNGLYVKDKNIEDKLSYSYFLEKPVEFYEFYKNNMMIDDFKPNIIHETLAKLEEKGYISGIITQNIDKLHQKAGSKNVIDIHGNGNNFYCTKCHAEYNSQYYINEGFHCNRHGCNGIIRPDIVLYQESISVKKVYKAYSMIDKADMIIVLGSSLSVSSISGLLNYFLRTEDEEKKLYIINNQQTLFDCYGYRYSEDLGETFEKIKKIVH